MARLPKKKLNEDEVTITAPDQSEETLSSVMEHVADNVEKAAEVTDESTDIVVEKPVKAPEDTTSDVVIEKPKPTAPRPATVKVSTTIDHHCFIGGKPYTFVKGVPTSVPEQVKDILRKAGILQAL